jgi:hypothetical protein
MKRATASFSSECWSLYEVGDVDLRRRGQAVAGRANSSGSRQSQAQQPRAPRGEATDPRDRLVHPVQDLLGLGLQSPPRRGQLKCAAEY